MTRRGSSSSSTRPAQATMPSTSPSRARPRPSSSPPMPDGLGHIVVVGAGVAGLTAADTLRRRGWGGTISVVGAETHRPYDRPPLSKQVLSAGWGLDRILL